MVCNVTGTLYQPDGTIVSDRQFMIRLVDSTISAGPTGGIVPDIISGRTGVDGSIDIDLFPGNYTIAVEPALNTNQRKQLIYIGPLSVPDAASIALSDALGIGAGYVPDVGAIIPPGSPGQVVGYDADGKPIPVDMAAASFPPGVGGQVVGYDINGTPVAVTLPQGMDAGTYDPQGIEADAFDMANMIEGADANILTDAERGKLAGIEAGAQVNAVASVNGKTGAVTLDAGDVGARPSGNVPWAEVAGKPIDFPPSAHSHVIGDVTGLQSALDGKAPAIHSHSWDAITGKPAVIAAGASQAAARSAIGAGTSNLALGTTSSTAKRGDWMPAWGDVSGKPAFGSAALASTGDFATAAQGAKADSAVQPGALGDLAAKDKVSVGDINATGTAGSGTYLRGDGAWVPVSGGGGGDMLVATYDPGGINGNAFDMGNMTETASAKIMTAAERSKLALIEAGAQVNAVLSVNAKTGAVTLIASDVGARADDWVPGWSDVTGKPGSFPPSAHSHAIGDVTGLQGALDGKVSTGHTHAWGDITGKPAVIAAGATQADARSAIGAGTSNLAIGTTSGTAKAGNYQPTWAQVTGKPAVIGAGATQADARAAIGAGTSDLVLGSTGSTAKAGNWMPGWADVSGKPTFGGAATKDVATLAEFASATADRLLATDSVYGDLVPLTDAATITVDLNAGYDFGGSGNAALTLGGNRTLGSPSNPRTGKKGVLWFTASAARTLTLHASWKLADGVEVGPYELAAGDLLGVAYVCVGSATIVTGIIKVGA